MVVGGGVKERQFWRFGGQQSHRRGRERLKAIWSALPRKIAFAAVILCLAGSTAWANLITNGSFETPVVPVGSHTNFGIGSTSITGWTVAGPTGNEVQVLSGSYSQNGFSFPAQDGVQWLDLTGPTSNLITGVEQTIATTLGATYDLSYYVGNQFDPNGFYGSTSTVSVWVDGTLIQTSTNSLGSGSTSQTWEKFSTSFLASSASTTIKFLNGDPLGDDSNGLDNIVLTQGTGTTPTPEPASLLLVGTGLLGLGWVVRRRLLTRPS